MQAFLKAAGLEAKEPPVATEESSQKQGGRRVTVYQLTQEFNVTTRESDKAEAAAGKVSTLFAQGIAVSANPLQYVSTPARAGADRGAQGGDSRREAPRADARRGSPAGISAPLVEPTWHLPDHAPQLDSFDGSPKD